MLDIARLQLSEFLCQKTVCESGERNCDRLMQAQDSRLVFSEGRRQFLEIVIGNLWMRFHDNPRLRSTHASSPRSFGAYDIAVFIEFLGVLPKIPDISVPVLCEIVKCILPQETSLKNSVVNYPTSHAVDHQGSVCNRELISLLEAFPFSSVNKSNAW